MTQSMTKSMMKYMLNKVGMTHFQNSNISQYIVNHFQSQGNKTTYFPTMFMVKFSWELNAFTLILLQKCIFSVIVNISILSTGTGVGRGEAVKTSPACHFTELIQFSLLVRCLSMAYMKIDFVSAYWLSLWCVSS